MLTDQVQPANEEVAVLGYNLYVSMPHEHGIQGLYYSFGDLREAVGRLHGTSNFVAVLVNDYHVEQLLPLLSQKSFFEKYGDKIKILLLSEYFQKAYADAWKAKHGTQIASDEELVEGSAARAAHKLREHEELDDVGRPKRRFDIAVIESLRDVRAIVT